MWFGPSPRAWGLPEKAGNVGAGKRTIPTLDAGPFISNGPSPRAWGLQDDLGNRPLGIRTIPTRVGITHRASLFCVGTSDHPHARGDYSDRARVSAVAHGPSPRAWGLLTAGDTGRARNRTIPTRVGITSSFGSCPSRSPDHPHARGDYIVIRGRSPTAFGPSPRAWGLHRAARNHDPGARTIPTRVGITAGRYRQWALNSDHPHARGDYQVFKRVVLRLDGPSPRAWGLHAWRNHRGAGQRTIPTRVGITQGLGNDPQAIADHPHARGDYVRQVRIRCRVAGPSPRAWGLPDANLADLEAARTIPTRVGITKG